MGDSRRHRLNRLDWSQLRGCAVRHGPSARANTRSWPQQSSGTPQLIAAGVGVVAAILPAIRAARLNVLGAISHE